jgi:hypothetical protein
VYSLTLYQETGDFYGRVAFASDLANPFGAWRFQLPSSYGEDVCPPSIRTATSNVDGSELTACVSLTGLRDKCQATVADMEKICSLIGETGGWMGIVCPGFGDGIASTALAVMEDLKIAAEKQAYGIDGDMAFHTRALQIFGFLTTTKVLAARYVSYKKVGLIFKKLATSAVPGYGTYCNLADSLSAIGMVCSIGTSLFKNNLCDLFPERRSLSYGYPPDTITRVAEDIRSRSQGLTAISARSSITAPTKPVRRSDNACRDL